MFGERKFRDICGGGGSETDWEAQSSSYLRWSKSMCAWLVGCGSAYDWLVRVCVKPVSPVHVSVCWPSPAGLCRACLLCGWGGWWVCVYGL